MLSSILVSESLSVQKLACLNYPYEDSLKHLGNFLLPVLSCKLLVK